MQASIWLNVIRLMFLIVAACAFGFEGGSEKVRGDLPR